MYSAHGLSLPSPGAIPPTFGHTIDARHYYPASTLATQLPRYQYDRDTTEYGKNNEAKFSKL